MHAIRIHAGFIADKELDVACYAEIERIRAELITSNDSVEVELNVGYASIIRV